ncbi:hypothetical protein IMSHALPRED_003213 [Imshaugia aleurites]|uniref:Uncharacterized protein n=1 Tax=Imshaugia aleurites TaxID=172621 RepID=A0A8H3J7D7_9LECA|nr:hypothetical protein IMSHALPRED_003213 [Imshaugia aleurites]
MRCYEWENVVYAYGDIWQVIGATVTHFGLTINDSGLHARIKEIEGTNKKGGLRFLTRDPLAMMDLIGLDGPRYEEGFSSLDELFEWAISMPLFRRKVFERETISGKQGRRLEKRPMHSKFVTEWLPQKMNSNASNVAPEEAEQIDSRAESLIPAATSATVHDLGDKAGEESGATYLPVDERHNLLSKALLRFNKSEQYKSLLENNKERTLKDAMWTKMRRILPLQGKQLGQAMMALKALVWWNDGQPRLGLQANKSLDKIPALDADTVDQILLPWINEHWR